MNKKSIKKMKEKLNREKDMESKVLELNSKGVPTEHLENLTVEEFEKLYANFKGISGKLHENRYKFYVEVEEALNKWTFEEIFIFMIDIFNTKILEAVKDNSEPTLDVSVEDIFPSLYLEVYKGFISKVSDKYEREANDTEDSLKE